MSNGVFQKNGSTYPVDSLSKRPLSRDLAFANRVEVYTDSSGTQHVNETRYAEVGLAYSGAQYTWEIFMVGLITMSSSDSLILTSSSGMPRTSLPLFGAGCS